MPTKPTTIDANQAAHRVVAETIARHETPLPADLEAAWRGELNGDGELNGTN
jgi:hypothetical protein